MPKLSDLVIRELEGTEPDLCSQCPVKQQETCKGLPGLWCKAAIKDVLDRE